MPMLTIDGKTVAAAEGATILEAARANKIGIPTLCHHPALEPWGGCRMCLVDVTRKEWDGWSKVVISCLAAAEDGLIVNTKSKRVVETRKVAVDLLLARCPENAFVQRLAKSYGITQTTYKVADEPTDCILCGLCTRICAKIGTSAISTQSRGSSKYVGTPFNGPPEDCIGCLSCAHICPTGHIRYTESATERTIWDRTFPLLKCKQCGKTIITEAQRDYLVEHEGLKADYFDLCDQCKRTEVSAKMATVGKAPAEV